MFWLKKIRDYFSQDNWRHDARQQLALLVKRSESPAGFMVMAIAGLFLVGAFQIASGPKDTPLPTGGAEITPHLADEAESFPDTVSASAVQESASEPETVAAAPNRPEQFRLRRNETLIGLMRRAGISNIEAHRAVSALRDVADLRRLQRGQEIRIEMDADRPGALRSLYMRDSFGEEARLIASDTGYRATREALPTLSLTHLVEGEIADSLYLSAERAGLPVPVIVDLIRLMSFDVDFEREIRKGDRFQVYYERNLSPDFGDLQEGKILHVKLELRNRVLEATYHEDNDGNGDYFDPQGNSTRKALMKTPLDVTVVTSSYGRRKHPVLGYTRQHTGVDFRARTGTPIMAAGDGVIERASRYGGYGNYIRIRHNSTYKTTYAHLSRYGKGIRAGARVKQGQIIGYAGATGRVTAAHLHYEVLVNGKHANPMTLELPTGRSLEGEQLANFQSLHGQLLTDIGQVQRFYQARHASDMAQDMSSSGQTAAR